MDAGFSELVQMATGQGLAVVMCIAFFWQSTKQNTKIIEWMAELGQKMSASGQATEKMLQATNTLIQCVDRLSNRIEVWERMVDNNMNDGR